MSSYGESTISSDSNSSNSSSGASKHIGKPVVSSDLTIGNLNSEKSKGEAAVSSFIPPKPIGKIDVYSGVSNGDPHSKKPNGAMIHNGKTGLSSGIRGKAAVSSDFRGKAIVSDNAGDVMSFRDVTFGPYEGELRFRLIDFWETRNALTKILIIDAEGTVIQGFIPSGRIDTYLRHMKAGAIYRLNKFFGSHNKTLHRVADPVVTITFSWNSALSVLTDSLVRFPEDRFRFHGYEEFEAACNLKEGLYDYFGHIKLVSGQVLSDSLVLDEVEIVSTRRVLLHVQTHDGPVMKLCLWD